MNNPHYIRHSLPIPEPGDLWTDIMPRLVERVNEITEILNMIVAAELGEEHEYTDGSVY